MSDNIRMYVTVYQGSTSVSNEAAKSVSTSLGECTVYFPDDSSCVYRKGTVYVMSLTGKTIAVYNLDNDSPCLREGYK